MYCVERRRYNTTSWEKIFEGSEAKAMQVFHDEALLHYSSGDMYRIVDANGNVFGETDADVNDAAYWQNLYTRNLND